MNACEILDAISERKGRGEHYYEFFLDRSLSLGIYGLSAGESDPQHPTLRMRSTTSCGGAVG